MKSEKYGSTLSAVRSGRVRISIERALKKIEQEMEEADGIYPGNGGRLSVAEVSRRAGVSSITLYGKNHRTTTLAMVRSWIGIQERTGRATRRGAKRSAAERVLEWKRRYNDIAASYKRMYSIEIVQRDAKIESLQKEVERLKAQVACSDQSSGKVVGIAGRKARKQPGVLSGS